MPGVAYPAEASSSAPSHVARKISSTTPHTPSGRVWQHDGSRPSAASTQPIASSSRTTSPVQNVTDFSNAGLFAAPETKDEDEDNSFLDVPDLVEYIFPDDVFPPQVNMDCLVPALMLPEAELWDNRRRIWRACPLLGRFGDTRPDERDAMPAFLNRITQRIYEACRANRCHPLPRRKWTSKFAAHEVAHTHAPDMCLVQQRFPPQWMDNRGEGPVDDGYTWEQVISSGLDLAGYSPARMLEALERDAYWQSCAQPTRRFSISVSFHSDGVRVHVLDCAGIVCSAPFDIHDEPARFVRLLAGMALADDASMGADTSIDANQRVLIAKEPYHLIERLYVTQGYIGPRTRVWRALRLSTDETVVVKDVWEDTDASFVNEAEMMERVRGVEGVAQLISSEVVTFNGRDDTTEHIRKSVKEGHKHFHRLTDSISLYTHRRLVITPFAEDLRHFRTKQELLYVFIDIVQTIERLATRRIMHSDISIGNVRIYDPPTLRTASTSMLSGSQRRQGMLIDMDNALEFDEDWNICSRPHEFANPGTTPFNSTELILNGAEGPRLIRYDLESLFYVLIWVCYHYSGPNGMRSQREHWASGLAEDPIAKWFNTDRRDLREACELKAEQMRDEAKFRDELLPALSGYFDDLRPCLLIIRYLMFGRGEQKITPGEMVDALAQGIYHLDERDARRRAMAEEAARREQRAREEEEARHMVAALKASRALAPKRAAAKRPAKVVVVAPAPRYNNPPIRVSQTRDPRKRARMLAQAKAEVRIESQPAWAAQSEERAADQTAGTSLRHDGSPFKRKAVEFDDAQSDASEPYRTKRLRTYSPSQAPAVASPGGAHWDTRAYEEHTRFGREYADQEEVQAALEAENAHRASVRAGKKRMFVYDVDGDEHVYDAAPSPKRRKTESESAGIPQHEAESSRSSYERARAPSPPSPTALRAVGRIRRSRASTPFPGMDDSDSGSGEGSAVSESEPEAEPKAESDKRKRVEEDEGEEPWTPLKRTKVDSQA